MEDHLDPGHGVPVPISSSPPHDHVHDEDHPDFSPVRSPELNESHVLLPSDQPTASVLTDDPSDQPTASVLTDDLRRKIIKQVEYYLSDENLPNDKFLLNYVTKNVEGFVPIGVIASFKKMKKLTRDTSLIVTALKDSTHLVVSSNGNKVKRLQPLSLTDIKDPMLCTVLVENLPDDHSLENLRRVFGEAGKVNNITIRDPHEACDPKKRTIAERLISGRLHALVEYDTVEAAEKAVATLNNEQDWRFGLRVKLLKKGNKPGQKKKIWKELEPEKTSKVQTSEPSAVEENQDSSEQLDDPHDEGVDHSSKEKNGVHPKEKNGNKGRNRGRGRGQKYQATSGHGHGTQLTSNHGFEPSKPPPGPKMPDGTRGFTMGRGRPLATS